MLNEIKALKMLLTNALIKCNEIEDKVARVTNSRNPRKLDSAYTSREFEEGSPESVRRSSPRLKKKRSLEAADEEEEFWDNGKCTQHKTKESKVTSKSALHKLSKRDLVDRLHGKLQDSSSIHTVSAIKIEKVKGVGVVAFDFSNESDDDSGNYSNSKSNHHPNNNNTLKLLMLFPLFFKVLLLLVVVVVTFAITIISTIVV